MLSHHASSAAPQTVQTAPPVCGAKNFSSVRLYSAPQLHRTIVAILGTCARNRQFSSAELCRNQTDPEETRAPNGLDRVAGGTTIGIRSHARLGETGYTTSGLISR